MYIGHFRSLAEKFETSSLEKLADGGSAWDSYNQ